MAAIQPANWSGRAKFAQWEYQNTSDCLLHWRSSGSTYFLKRQFFVLDLNSKENALFLIFRALRGDLPKRQSAGLIAASFVRRRGRLRHEFMRQKRLRTSGGRPYLQLECDALRA
jgi:hypothetical protein